MIHEEDIQEVARLVIGDLDPEAARRLETRLEREPALRAIRASLVEMVSALERDETVPAPTWLIDRAVSLLRRDPSAEDRAQGRPAAADRSATPARDSLGARIIAALMFDSRSQPALGFRGEASGYHLVYGAEKEKIDLHVEPTDGAWRVRGQIGETQSATTGSVDFIDSKATREVSEAPIDEFGYFEAIAPAGEYELRVRLPETTIVLEQVRLG